MPVFLCVCTGEYGWNKEESDSAEKFIAISFLDQDLLTLSWLHVVRVVMDTTI